MRTAMIWDKTTYMNHLLERTMLYLHCSISENTRDPKRSYGGLRHLPDDISIMTIMVDQHKVSNLVVMSKSAGVFSTIVLLHFLGLFVMY